MRRITVPLKDDERDALWKLAERERRDPRDQAALLVARELERAGLLTTSKPEEVEVETDARR